MRVSERAVHGGDLLSVPGIVIPTNGKRKSDFITLLLLRNLQRKERKRIIELLVDDQQSFDELFSLIFHYERPLLVRAADAVENITVNHPEYLQPHKAQILNSFKGACPKELQWHMARLVSRIELTETERDDVWHILSYWALNKNENKIVRVNALQGLFELSMRDLNLKAKLVETIDLIGHELNPSFQTSVRKLKRKLNVR